MGGAVLMVVENAPTNHRGLLGSMVQIGNPIGVLAAVAIFSLVFKLPDQELMSWGWRIPFLISIFLVGIGLYIRLSLVETPVFRQLKLNDGVAAIPVVEILTKHRRPFLTAIGLKISEIVISVSPRLSICMRPATRPPPERDLQSVQMSAAVALIAIPTFGWLADNLGRKTMFIGSCLFSIAFAFPMFWLLDTKDPHDHNADRCSRHQFWPNGRL